MALLRSAKRFTAISCIILACSFLFFARMLPDGLTLRNAERFGVEDLSLFLLPLRDGVGLMPGRREGVGVLLPIDGEGIPIGYILVGVYRPTCLRGTTNDGRVRVLLSLASGSNFDFSNSIFLILERILAILER